MDEHSLTDLLITWGTSYVAYSALRTTMGGTISLVVLCGDILIERNTKPIATTHFASRLLKAVTILAICIPHGYTPTNLQLGIVLVCAALYGLHEYMRSQVILDDIYSTVIQGILAITMLTSILLGIF